MEGATVWQNGRTSWLSAHYGGETLSLGITHKHKFAIFKSHVYYARTLRGCYPQGHS
jgi:hypothetical protein